jgi:L-lactate dehydrogenase complex protein LldG
MVPHAGAGCVVSLVPGVGRTDLDPAALERPHELANVIVAVVPGAFAVAENGAVWLDGRDLGRHRVLFVIAEHLVVVVPAAELVQTMHDAYARLARAPGFGSFVCGPSKTADIEGVLVTGAHGPRSCTVVLVG